LAFRLLSSFLSSVSAIILQPHSHCAQGQTACNNKKVGLVSTSSISCLNPFYAEPLCDSACIVFFLFATASAWLVKEEKSEPLLGANRQVPCCR
jgi:hypothetical protein